MQALLVYNPSAGMRNSREQLERAMSVLRERGWSLELEETSRSGDARRFASEAAERQLDALIAVGGDGTLNEVADGLVDSRTALGVLPLGTANVWAREMGLPLGDLPAAARLLAGAEVRVIDVGQVCGPTLAPRVFLIACGIGLDAAITHAVEPQRQMKRRLGMLLFWLVGIRQAWNYRGRMITLTFPDQRERRRVILALVANTQLYGGVVRIAPNAKVDDGLLNVVVFKGTGVWTTALHLVRVFFGSHLNDPQVEMHRVTCVTVEGRNLPVHVDAEPIGFAPVEIRVRPKSLAVLVPKTANRDIFSQSVRTAGH